MMIKPYACFKFLFKAAKKEDFKAECLKDQEDERELIGDLLLLFKL